MTLGEQCISLFLGRIPVSRKPINSCRLPFSSKEFGRWLVLLSHGHTALFTPLTSIHTRANVAARRRKLLLAAAFQSSSMVTCEITRPMNPNVTSLYRNVNLSMSNHLVSSCSHFATFRMLKLQCDRGFREQLGGRDMKPLPTHNFKINHDRFHIWNKSRVFFKPSKVVSFEKWSHGKWFYGRFYQGGPGLLLFLARGQMGKKAWTNPLCVVLQRSARNDNIHVSCDADVILFISEGKFTIVKCTDILIRNCSDLFNFLIF